VLSFSGSGPVCGPDVARSFIFAGVVIVVISIAATSAARKRGVSNTGKPTVSIKKAPKENSTIAIVNKPSVIVSETA
jgi:hypothetical protein